MKPLPLLCLPLVLLLTQCLEPYPYGPAPYGAPPPPYSGNQPGYHAGMNDYARQQNQQAYERGIQDGRTDAELGRPRSATVRWGRFDQNTAQAYQDGYATGYDSISRHGAGAPAYAPEAQRSPAYNQGYDYGIRDRAAQRPSDPNAHVGSYDPRYRGDFERGYRDAYGSVR